MDIPMVLDDGEDRVVLLTAYVVELTRSQGRLVERSIASVDAVVPSSMIVSFQLWGADTAFSLPLPATAELCKLQLLKVTKGPEPTLIPLKEWMTPYEKQSIDTP